MNGKLTKKAYEEYLNTLSPGIDDDAWIIGGDIRVYHMYKGAYGEATRQYDPIGFEVGYKEWVSNH